MQKLPIALTLMAGLLLSACTNLNNSSDKSAVCNELKSKLLFNGSTSNVRKADIQNSEDALLQKQYDQSCN